jgi:hypothetical protein
MAASCRYIIALGFISVSDSDDTGSSRGSPPPWSTPRLTDSASARRFMLQPTSSLHVLTMPTTGRPANASSEKPTGFIQARWLKPLMSSPSNQ